MMIFTDHSRLHTFVDAIVEDMMINFQLINEDS